jgi:polyribonucleotide nucleotidyltransferase
MFDIKRKTIEWGGRKLVLETGKIARQADGAVLATYGETVVLCHRRVRQAPKAGIDFFPLTVNYQEKTFAAGKIPGGYFKREGRPTEKETLVSRLIDRPIRPLFVEGYKNETQVVCTVLQHDLENDPDIVGDGRRLGRPDHVGRALHGPDRRRPRRLHRRRLQAQPDCRRDEGLEAGPVVAGTTDAVMMVESEAKELSEDIMLGAVMFAHKHMQPVIDAIIRLAEQAAKEPLRLRAGRHTRRRQGRDEEAGRRDIAPPTRSPPSRALQGDRRRQEEGHRRLVSGENPDGDHRQGAGRRPVQGSPKPTSCVATSSTPASASTAATSHRPQDRGGSRHPAAHPRFGAVHPRRNPGPGRRHPRHRRRRAVHRRPGRHLQENFLLHYNFPPYSVGEAGRMGSPGRREIGHGKLAWRAIRPMLPAKEEFPYTIRVVSEITESNGSSSMATVCGTSLALMDAGVPLKAPVAGIAMGLILEGDASRSCRTSWVTRITSATWTSRSPAPAEASPRCRWTSRSPASPRRS